jgi:hypothetical protein
VRWSIFLLAVIAWDDSWGAVMLDHCL